MFDPTEDPETGLLGYPELKDALLGAVEQRGNPPVACYSKKATIRLVQKTQRMTERQAIEAFEFSIMPLDYGEATPVFLDQTHVCSPRTTE